MTLVQLKEVCHLHNKKPTVRKDGVINNIYQTAQVIHSTANPLKPLVWQLKSAWLPKKAPTHEVYKSFFNLIELTDCHFKSVDHHHCIEDWRVKFSQIILYFATLNVWSTFAANHLITYLTFHQDL
jgi:hypothetical protein